MWGRTTAGILAGLPLAALLSALIVALLPVGLEAQVATAVLLMLPMWSATFCLAFSAPPGWRAWAVMLLANAAALVLVLAVQAVGLLKMPG